MKPLEEIACLLQKIERTYASERSKAIGELQDKILDDAELQTDELYFLQELAGDLNFTNLLSQTVIQHQAIMMTTCYCN